MAADGFGTRTRRFDPATGDEVEVLELSSWLVEHTGFVSALAERVARLAAVRHPSYTQLRRLDRPSPPQLQLVSDYTPGTRLSKLLSRSHADRIALDITVVIGLLRQLLPAVALYGRNNRDAAIGTLSVERLIVTPEARLVIAEHAFGPALEKLNLGRERLWRDLRVAMPPSAGLPRANQRADANAIGVIALSLLLGRPLEPSEFPSQLRALAEGLTETRDGVRSPLPPAMARWLARALQFDVGDAFQAPSEALVAFESVLASDRAYVTHSAALVEWNQRVQGSGAQHSSPVEDRAKNPEVHDEPAESIEPITIAAPSRRPLFILAGVVVLLLAVIGWLWTRDPGQPRAGEGELVVDSRPPGARITIDGKESGVTPATLRLPSGAHVLEVKIGDAEPRIIPLMIRAGVQTAQYVELQVPPAAQPLSPPKRSAEKKGRR